MVQQPGKKIKWAPFLQGTHGCGKSAYADIMSAVIGATNVNIVDKCKLESNFNDWAYGCQLLVFDEIMTGEDKKKMMDKLKPIITQPTIGLSRKFQDSANVPNRTNALFLSNHEDGIRVDAGERRYFVLRSLYQTKAQVETLPEGYFTRLFSLAGPLAGAVRHFLMNFPLHPEFDPLGAAPRNADWDSIVSTSLNEVDYSARMVLNERDSPFIQPDIISFSHLRDVLRPRLGRGLSDKTLANALIRLGYKSWGQASIAGQRPCLWVHNEYEPMLGDPDEVLRERFFTHQTRELPTE